MPPTRSPALRHRAVPGAARPRLPGVVALTLALGRRAIVLHRLDDYFTQQQQADLRARAGDASIRTSVVDVPRAEPARPAPIVVLTGRPARRAAATASRALGSADRRPRRDRLAQAERRRSTLRIDRPGTTGRRTFVPAPGRRVLGAATARRNAGQARERDHDRPATRSGRERRSTRLSAGRGRALRAVHVPGPDARERSSSCSSTIALGRARVVAIVVACSSPPPVHDPLRRLTRRRAALAEGDLDVARAGRPGRAERAAELAELAASSTRWPSGSRRASRSSAATATGAATSWPTSRHELRTPIAALRTFNELLAGRRGATDPAARAEFLESSRQQIERLDWLAPEPARALEARLGLVLLDLRPDDLRAAVEIGRRAGATAAARGGASSCRVDLPERAASGIRHDPQRIGQVRDATSSATPSSSRPRGGTVDGRRCAADRRGRARSRSSTRASASTPTELPHDLRAVLPRLAGERGARQRQRAGPGDRRSIVDMHGGAIEVESRLGAGRRSRSRCPRSARGRRHAGCRPRPGRERAAHHRAVPARRRPGTPIACPCTAVAHRPAGRKRHRRGSKTTRDRHLGRPTTPRSAR